MLNDSSLSRLQKQNAIYRQLKAVKSFFDILSQLSKVGCRIYAIKWRVSNPLSREETTNLVYGVRFQNTSKKLDEIYKLIQAMNNQHIAKAKIDAALLFCQMSQDELVWYTDFNTANQDAQCCFYTEVEDGQRYVNWDEAELWSPELIETQMYVELANYIAEASRELPILFMGFNFGRKDAIELLVKGATSITDHREDAILNFFVLLQYSFLEAVEAKNQQEIERALAKVGYTDWYAARR